MSELSKSDFFTGHSGGSIEEIMNVFVAIAVASITAGLIRGHHVFELAVDVTLHALFPVFLFTVPGLSTSLLFPILLMLLLLITPRSDGRVWNQERKVAVDYFRGALIQLTTLCILAVDFEIFPRRFAKTEMYGISLMDCGVGMFTYSFGLSAAFSNKSQSMLWVAGFIRLLFVKISGYHEHVTEYGVHWNFFFTLAMLSVLYQKSNYFFSLLVLLLHELMLYFCADYIENSLRLNLFSQNREGILSLGGYYALFLYAKSTGLMLRGTKKLTEWHRTIFFISLRSLCLYLLFLILPLQPSRRMANLKFVIGSLLLCDGVLATCLFGVGIKNVRFSRVYMNLSKRMLWVFITANIITGILNLSTSLADKDPTLSRLILSIYCLILNIIY